MPVIYTVVLLALFDRFSPLDSHILPDSPLAPSCMARQGLGLGRGAIGIESVS